MLGRAGACNASLSVNLSSTASAEAIRYKSWRLQDEPYITFSHQTAVHKGLDSVERSLTSFINSELIKALSADDGIFVDIHI